MREIIIELGLMSVRASLVIGVVLILRMIFDKLHIVKKYSALLWVIPFLCLVLPWRMESDFSAWRLFENIKLELVQENSVVEQAERLQPLGNNEYVNSTNSQIDYLNDVAKENGNSNIEYESAHQATLQEETGNLAKDISVDGYQILFSIWIVGGVSLLAYGIGSYSRLQSKVLCSEKMKDNIYLADDISVPFVLGIVSPKIYVPANMRQKNMQYVIEHEKTHIMRKDYLWKLIACLTVGIHWFNPFVWVAFRLWEKDIEMVCDEETINRIGADNRWDYANVLLLISSGRKELSELFVAFGEGDTKGRIENILKDKNTVKWIAAVAVMLVVILGVVFLTKPTDMAVMEKDVVEATADTDIVKESESTVGIKELDLALILEGAEEVAVTPAKEVTEEILCGADGAIFDYLDTEWYEQIIFHDYYGLFVYNLNWGKGIVRSLDLEAIGCNYTQGDFACEVKVTEDGRLVYLKPMNAEEGYIFDVEADKLYRKVYDMETINGFAEWKQTSDVLPETSGMKSSLCYVFDGNNYCHYLLSETGLARDLRWRVDWVDAENGLSVCEQDDAVFGDYIHTENIEENIAHLEELIVQLQHQYANFLEEVEKLQTEAGGPTSIIGVKASYTKQMEELRSALKEERQALQAQGSADETIVEKQQVLLAQLDKFEEQLLVLQQKLELQAFLQTINETEREFTMEELITLCESGRDNLQAVMDTQVDNCYYTNFVREESKDSLTWNYFCPLSYNGKEYRLQVSYWKTEEALKYDHYINQLAAVYLMETSSTETRMLYDCDVSPREDSIDIKSFIGRRYSIDDYLTLDMPEGLSMGNYTVGFMESWDGCVFSGDVEEPMHGDWCPEAWYASGGIGVSRPENYGERATFEDGKLVSVSWGMNHGERISDFEHVDGCSMEAVICEYAFDTFTAAESEEYKEKYNLSDADMQTISNYWYVFLAEEESGFVFCTFLNQQYYDKEDAIALAKSVRLQQ